MKKLYNHITAFSTIKRFEYDSDEEYFEAVEDYEDDPKYVFSESVEDVVDELNAEIGYDVLELHRAKTGEIESISLINKDHSHVVEMIPHRNEINLQLADHIDINEDIDTIIDLVGDVSTLMNDDVGGLISYVSENFNKK
jgi:hypothetical protein